MIEEFIFGLHYNEQSMTIFVNMQLKKKYYYTRLHQSISHTDTLNQQLKKVNRLKPRFIFAYPIQSITQNITNTKFKKK